MSSGSQGPNITFNNQIILPVAQQLALISLHQWTLRLHSARLGVCLDFALWKRFKFGFIWLPATHPGSTLTKDFLVFLPSYSNRHSLVFYHRFKNKFKFIRLVNNDCCTWLVTETEKVLSQILLWAVVNAACLLCLWTVYPVQKTHIKLIW